MLAVCNTCCSWCLEVMHVYVMDTEILSGLIENSPSSLWINIFGGNRRNVLENLKLKLDILIAFFSCVGQIIHRRIILG